MSRAHISVGGAFDMAGMPVMIRNLAFGGPDLRTLYLTPRSSLLELHIKTPGIGAFM